MTYRYKKEGLKEKKIEKISKKYQSGRFLALGPSPLQQL